MLLKSYKNITQVKYQYLFRLRFFSTSVTKNTRLIVEPKSCLQDELVHIKAIDLIPGSKVTITSTVKDTRDHYFFSYTHYIANNLGVVDLLKDEAIGGSFTGLFPMGPIACLLPGPKENKFLRYLKRDLDVPNLIDIKLLLGHPSVDTAFQPQTSMILDSATHERIYMAPGVERIPIKEGKLRGCLYLPAGDGPFPGVIDVFGTAGGLIEHRSAQLASRGIASLALAYFGYDDLPKNLDFLDMSYFEEGAKLLLNNKKVKKSSIGAVGNSKGGDLACSMGAFIPEVKAVVCINGLPVNTWCDLKVKDIIIPGLQFDVSRAEIIGPDLIKSRNMMDNTLDFPGTFLPLHESDAQFLFLVSMDDQNWHTDLEVERSIQRMKDNGYHKFEQIDSDSVSTRNVMYDPKDFPDTYLPLHESNARFLFLVAMDDQNWNPELEAERGTKRMRDFDFHEYEIRKYEGAGHLLEPPFSPFSYANYNKYLQTGINWGGNPKDHSTAQEQSWQYMITFLKSNLG